MEAYILPSGNLLIPKRAEGPDGLIGDGMIEVAPGSAEYREWKPYAVPLPPNHERTTKT